MFANVCEDGLFLPQHLFVVFDPFGQLKVKLCDGLGGTCNLACPGPEKTKLYHPQKLCPPFSEPILTNGTNYELKHCDLIPIHYKDTIRDGGSTAL